MEHKNRDYAACLKKMQKISLLPDT